MNQSDFSLKISFIKSISTISMNLIVIAFMSFLIEITSIKEYIKYIVDQFLNNIENRLKNRYKFEYNNLNIDELNKYLYLLLEETVNKQREKCNIFIPQETDHILYAAKQLLPKMINDFANGDFYEDYNVRRNNYEQIYMDRTP